MSVFIFFWETTFWLSVVVVSTGGVVSYSSSLYFVGANCKGTCFFGTLYICMERNLLFRTPHIICVFFKEMFLKFTKKTRHLETLDVFLRVGVGVMLRSIFVLQVIFNIDLKLGVNYDESLSEKSCIARVLDLTTMPLKWRDISACTSPERL